MKKVRLILIWTVIVLSCLLIFASAQEDTTVIQGEKSNARIIYNSEEVNLGLKPVLIEGYNYLSVRAISSLFDKSIYWNQSENEILITDKTNPQVENLALELDAKNKKIEELEAKVKALEEKVKTLEKDIAIGKKSSIRELQDKINDNYGEYEGVIYRVILSGNEDEIRVKIEIDLSRDKSEWNSLSITGRDEIIEEVFGVIYEEYDSAKIKGYFKDISESRELRPFHYNWLGELENSYPENYSTISIIEDKFNNDYDDYLKDIHLTFALNGNDSIVKYTAYIQKDRFEDEWKRLSDNTVKNLMKKLCGEISSEFNECYIYGNIYDTDSNNDLAFCEQTIDGDFIFDMEQ